MIYPAKFRLPDYRLCSLYFTPRRTLSQPCLRYFHAGKAGANRAYLTSRGETLLEWNEAQQLVAALLILQDPSIGYFQFTVFSLAMSA